MMMNKSNDFPNLMVADHPIIKHKLSEIRDVKTGKRLFRENLKQIAMLLAYHATSDLAQKTAPIQTPMQEYDAPCLKDGYPIIVPILRAGLALSDGLEEVFPESVIAHVGMYRDHETHEAVEYLNKLPNLVGRDVLLVDPMLATGNSAVHAVEMMVAKGADLKRVKFVVLVAAPEGVKNMSDKFPDVTIYTAALDEKLNENAYILPGLGDAGDRCFGTV